MRCEKDCGVSFYRSGAIREYHGPVEDMLRVHREVQRARSSRKASRSPWGSGSFYLAVTLLLSAFLVVGGWFVSVWVLSIVAITSLVGVATVGVLQLRFDDRLSEQAFLPLVVTAMAKISSLHLLMPKQNGGPPPRSSPDRQVTVRGSR